MEFIVPLILLFILTVIAAAIAAWATRKWIRGKTAAIVLALFLPGLFAAYVLVVSHFRDNYHRRRSETYNFDGNCVVVLEHGYKLDYFDEFPKFARLSVHGRGEVNSYNADGAPVRLLEDGVQRVGEISTGVYGAASGRNALPSEPIDHYFFISYLDGSSKRFKTEPELRNAVPGLGAMSNPDELFSIKERKERLVSITWILFSSPIVIAVLAWRGLRRWSVDGSNDRSLASAAQS